MEDKLKGLGLMNFAFSTMMVNQNIQEKESTEEQDFRDVDFDLLHSMQNQYSASQQEQGNCCPMDGEQLFGRS